MKRVLFIHNYKPIIHGAALISNYIRTSELINSFFITSHINTSTSLKSDELGKINVNKILSIIKLYVKIYKTIKIFKPDVVYTNFAVRKKGFLKDIISILLIGKNKKIIHFHNLGISNRKGFFEKRILNKILNNSHIILISKSIKYELESYKPLSLNYCNNSIKIKQPFLEKSINIKRINILFIGNLYRYKGIFDLIKVAEKLKKQKINFIINVLGSSGDVSLEEFKDKVKLKKLSENIVLHGFLKKNKKKFFLETSDIYLHPTYYDVFPMVLLEAQAFSLPIISYDMGGINDIVIDNFNGFLISDDKLNKVCQSIIKYSNDDMLYKKHSLNSYQTFIKKFDIEIFEKNMINILNKI